MTSMKRASLIHQERGVRSGFTIIETVLFLGITGLMIATMFIGIGSTVGAQRYRDSVESFKATLQQQYSEVVNTYNDRTSQWACTPNGDTVTVTPVSSGTPRGQAQCVVLGKYMTIRGGDISTRTVIAWRPAAMPTDTDTDDITILRDRYSLGVSPIDAVDTSLEWGTAITWPKGTNPQDRGTGQRSMAMLVVRSPESGSIYTFTGNTVPVTDEPSGEQLKALIQDNTTNPTEPGRAKRLICVDSSGIVLTPNRGIYIESQAADSSAVRVALPDDFNGSEQC